MWTVLVDQYPISPRVEADKLTPVARFPHRTRKAACRRLAAILSGRSKAYRDIYATTPGHGKRFVIQAPDGREFALRPAQALRDC